MPLALASFLHPILSILLQILLCILWITWAHRFQPVSGPHSPWWCLRKTWVRASPPKTEHNNSNPWSCYRRSGFQCTGPQHSNCRKRCSRQRALPFDGFCWRSGGSYRSTSASRQDQMGCFWWQCRRPLAADPCLVGSRRSLSRLWWGLFGNPDATPESSSPMWCPQPSCGPCRRSWRGPGGSLDRCDARTYPRSDQSPTILPTRHRFYSYWLFLKKIWQKWKIYISKRTPYTNPNQENWCMVMEIYLDA